MSEHAGRITLIGGGARSGKSTYALERAREVGAERVYVATAKPVDDDMKARIARHQAERPDFRTIEAPLELPRAIASIDGADVVVIDCVTFWVSNLMLRGDDADALLGRVDELVDAMRAARHRTILVTNEVGMSVHPPTELGRRFADLCGWTHQRLSRAADEVFLAVIGTIVRVRPAPFGAIDRAT